MEIQGKMETDNCVVTVGVGGYKGLNSNGKNTIKILFGRKRKKGKTVKFDDLGIKIRLVILVMCLISSQFQLSGYRHKVERAGLIRIRYFCQMCSF